MEEDEQIEDLDIETEESHFNPILEARIGKFKKEGLVVLEEDMSESDRYHNAIFEVAFATFINEGTHDEIREFIAQIPNIQDKLGFFQSYGISNLCAIVLAFVEDTDRKTWAMQALFDAGIDYSMLKGDDKLFLYSDNKEDYCIIDEFDDESEVFLPYLKAILSSKNCNKFTEAVQDLLFAELELGRDGIFLPEMKPILAIGIKVASEYLRDNPVVGREVLKPFYKNLNDPATVIGHHYNVMQKLSNINEKEVQKCARAKAFGHDIDLIKEFEIIRKNFRISKTLQKEFGIFNEEFEKIPSLENLILNTINGVVKDKKSIQDLNDLPNPLKLKLKNSYNDTIHPEKREAYNQDYSKSDKLAKFTQPQISDNRAAQGAKNKSQSVQDVQHDSGKSNVTRRKGL